MKRRPPPPRKPPPSLPGFRSATDSQTYWFSRRGCVVLRATGEREVYVGAGFVGRFETGNTAMRNLLLVTVASHEGVVFENLAVAFGMGSETVRMIRRLHEAEGLMAVVSRKVGSQGAYRVTPTLKAKVLRLFGEGLSQIQTRRALKGKLSAGTLNKLHKEWRASQAAAAKVGPTASPQGEMSLSTGPLVPTEPVVAVAAEPVVAVAAEPVVAVAAEPVVAGVIEAKRDESGYVARASNSSEVDGRVLPVDGPVSKRQVQFLGAWLLVAMTARLGLHSALVGDDAKRGDGKALGLAVSAVTVALGIGEACIEGVRRLAHQSAAALLLAVRAPSPTWVRKVLGAAAAKGQGFFIHARLSGGLMRDAASRAGEVAVFYVDNHLRPYTGFRRLLYGWRMQDKRAMAGTTDFHVHDVTGRPMYRIATRAHDSLGKLLLPIAELIRIAVGKAQRILLAFDRAASYGEVLAVLRDAAFEFVVYEKKPYRLVPLKYFREELSLDGETVRWYERRANLGKGRGRVRRICVRLPDGHQLNLLAHSEASAESLITIMTGRWSQENAFHHGVRRWGLNQLDGRTFNAFEPDEVISNPERRRLDASLAALREAEGQLHRKLLRATRFELLSTLESELAKNLEQQRILEEQRAGVPTHCSVEDAGLHGQLMRHDDEYKALVDTIRAACINAEAALAAELAPEMSRPREAKRLLRNFFSASGDLQVKADSIEVVLDIAANDDERSALKAFCRAVNALRLSHPGDAAARPLRFRTQIS